MKVSNRRTITISQTLTASNVFTRRFHLGFEPDEMIVRQVSYGFIIADNNLSVLHTDLVTNGAIIAHIFPNSVPDVTTYCPMSVFTVDRTKINNAQCTFTVYSTTTNDQLIPNPNADGSLVLTLEFVKYSD